MAKVKIPKRLMGCKVPRKVRKSPVLKGLLGSKIGREIAAQALVAAASAAAAVLVREREDVANAARTGARKGARTLAVVTEAVESASEAAIDVVTDAARSMLPEEISKGARKRKSSGKPGTRKAPAPPAEGEVRH